MSERFGAAALRLAGVAGIALGWRPDEFWRATPAELAAVLAPIAPADGQGVGSDELARLKRMFPDG